MGRNKDAIDEVAKNFAKKIKARFKPARVILFGSRAYGEAWQYSDYDFIIVSDSFENVHWLDRISDIVRYWDSDRSIDVLPYTTREFDSKKEVSTMVREAVKKGVEI